MVLTVETSIEVNHVLYLLQQLEIIGVTDVDGIIILGHCNRNNSDYYQANTSLSTHKVGVKIKDGGIFCEFVKSDSRTINTSKITVGSSDYTTSGNADIADERIVFLYGRVSGFDAGRVKEVNQWWNAPAPINGWVNNLYKVESISFTDGDSGAPIIDYYNGKYGGMNIGTDGTYQMVHDWTFLKSELGLN